MPYPHTTWSTVGADVPHMDLTLDEKDVVNLCLDGITNDSSPLRNPLIGKIKIRILWHQTYMIWRFH